jgi:hypothetical protein
MAWLAEQFGTNRLREVTVVLPTHEFFPDDYSATHAGACVILNRVCSYLAVNAKDIDLRLFEDRNPNSQGETQQGPVGMYEPVEGKHRVWVEIKNLHDPLALVATMAHELGHVILLGQHRVDHDASDHEPLTDLLTVFMGLGVVTANAVIREAYQDYAHWSRWRISRQGYLTMPMFAYALALFARIREENEPAWAKHLRLDVRKPFKQACQFLDQLPDIPCPQSIPPYPFPASKSSAGAETIEPAAEPDAVTWTSKALLSCYQAGQRDFTDADLSGLDLHDQDLSGVTMAQASLQSCNLTGAVLAHADLTDADLSRAILRQVDLSHAKLNDAELRKADLSHASLECADIRGADFTAAILHKAILRGAIRDRRTDMTNVDLSEIIADGDLKTERLDGTSNRDAVVKWHNAFTTVVGLVFCLGLAVLFGSTLGLIVGNVLGIHRDNVTAIAGAALGLGLVVWHFLRHRKRS